MDALQLLLRQWCENQSRGFFNDFIPIVIGYFVIYYSGKSKGEKKKKGLRIFGVIILGVGIINIGYSIFRYIRLCVS